MTFKVSVPALAQVIDAPIVAALPRSERGGGALRVSRVAASRDHLEGSGATNAAV